MDPTKTFCNVLLPLNVPATSYDRRRHPHGVYMPELGTRGTGQAVLPSLPIGFGSFEVQERLYQHTQRCEHLQSCCH